MKLLWTTQAWDDYQSWLATDRKVLKKINSLIKDVQRSPFTGIGHPEPLKHQLTGWWAREITDEHRLVYRTVDAGDSEAIEIAQCRGHY